MFALKFGSLNPEVSFNCVRGVVRYSHASRMKEKRNKIFVRYTCSRAKPSRKADVRKEPHMITCTVFTPRCVSLGGVGGRHDSLMEESGECWR